MRQGLTFDDVLLVPKRSSVSSRKDINTSTKLSRNIEIELSLHEKKRKPCRDFLKVCRAEYDNLMESSPSIDLDVIQLFNKKFENKYPNIRKPIIVNGLREIKPYNSGLVEDKYEIMDNNREPQPEPEPQIIEDQP